MLAPAGLRAADIVWDANGGTGGSAWLTKENWNPDTAPSSSDTAVFQDTAGSTFIGITFSNTTNNGPGNQIVGAISLTGGEERTIRNTSNTLAGTLTLNGVSGALLSNSSTFGLTLDGTANSGMNVALANSGNISITSSGNIIITSSIGETSGSSKGITKTGSGSGTLTLSGSNTYTGATKIEAGTLLLGASDRISDSSNMELAGGTFRTGGFSETVGALTLSASSTLDMGAINSNSLSFAHSASQSWMSETTLTIFNYDGLAGSGNRIFFGSSTGGLTQSQLNQISAFSGGMGSTALGALKLTSSGELIAVPEPGTALAALAILGAGLLHDRRRHRPVSAA